MRRGNIDANTVLEFQRPRGLKMVKPTLFNFGSGNGQMQGLPAMSQGALKVAMQTVADMDESVRGRTERFFDYSKNAPGRFGDF